MSASGTVKDDCHRDLRRFYNYIWLVLNDIIIGWAVGAVVCEHSQVIASFLDTSIRVGFSLSLECCGLIRRRRC